MKKTVPVIEPPPERAPSRRRKSLKRQRMAAKVGMAASMGVLLYTGLRRGRRYMVPHVWAGLGLIGLSIWHWALYQRGAGRGPARLPDRRRTALGDG